MSLRDRLILACRDYVNSRVKRINLSIEDLKESLNNETKSSAGDKYETGREMINLEFEKLSSQLIQLNKLNATLNMLENQVVSRNIQFGSIIRTNKANYFISIPAGVIKVNDEVFYAVGANSPIAIMLNGKNQEETFILNSEKFEILSVD